MSNRIPKPVGIPRGPGQHEEPIARGARLGRDVVRAPARHRREERHVRARLDDDVEGHAGRPLVRGDRVAAPVLVVELAEEHLERLLGPPRVARRVVPREPPPAAREGLPEAHVVGHDAEVGDVREPTRPIRDDRRVLVRRVDSPPLILLVRRTLRRPVVELEV